MTRANAVRREVVVAGDLGPLIDGAVHPSREVEAIADVPGRKVTRAMRAPLYHRVWKRGGISDLQWEAAERYARLHEIAEGARDADGDRVRVDGGETRGDGPSVRQLDSLRALRMAHSLLGPHARRVLDDLVVRDLSLLAYADAVRLLADQSPVVRSNRVLGLLDAALHRLVEHWALGA